MNIKITKKTKPMTRIRYAMLYPKQDFKVNDSVFDGESYGIVKSVGYHIIADFSGKEKKVKHSFADKNWQIRKKPVTKTLPKPVTKSEDDIFEQTDAEAELAKLRTGGLNTIPSRSISVKRDLPDVNDVEWGEDGVSLGLEDLQSALLGGIPENPMKDLKGLTTPIIQANKGSYTLEDKLKDIWS